MKKYFRGWLCAEAEIEFEMGKQDLDYDWLVVSS